MPRGRTKSKMTLKQRREQAFSMFAKGFSDSEIAKKLRVTRQTINNYRRKYEEAIQDEAISNPRLMQDALGNTIRSLHELDQIRENAWKELEDRKLERRVKCPNCDHRFHERFRDPVADHTRVQYLNTLLKAQDQRAKLFGVLGVKQEVFVLVAQVKYVQDKILEFLTRSLCLDDRRKLEEFLTTNPEISEYMSTYGEQSLDDVLELEAEQVS